MKSKLILLIFFLTALVTPSQELPHSVLIKSNEGYSSFSTLHESKSFWIFTYYDKDYLVIEQSKFTIPSDNGTRLYFFLGRFYVDMYLKKRECVQTIDGCKCYYYFEFTDKILNFIIHNKFPDPVVGSIYIKRDNEIEVFRPSDKESIEFYNMIKEYCYDRELY